MPTPKVNVPKVSTQFEDKKAGQAVDQAFNKLKQELATNYQAPDAAAVGGTTAAAIARDLFFQAFEDDVTETWNLRDGSLSVVTFNSNGVAGGRALKSTGEVHLAFPENILFDPDRLYRFRARLRRTSSTATGSEVFVGVEGVAADGVTLVDRSGGTDDDTMHHVVVNGDSGDFTLNDWQSFVGYLKGTAATGTATAPSTDSDAPTKLHEDCRYFRPFFILNNGGASVEYEIDYISVEVLTETPEVNSLLSDVGGRTPVEVGGTVRSGGGVAANQVYSDSIRTGAVLADAIAANAVTASKINVSSLDAISANIGTITAGTLQADVVVAAESFTAARSNFESIAIAEGLNYIRFEDATEGQWAGWIRHTHATPLKTGSTLRGLDIGYNLIVTGTNLMRVTEEYVRCTVPVYNRSFSTISGSQPEVVGISNAETNNTSATTVDDFLYGDPGMFLVVKVEDSNTTFDFSSGTTNLAGNGGVDYSASSGDVLFFWKDDNGTWQLISMK